MDILIVGSGIVGLVTAFELASAGYRVRIVTRNYEEGASWVAGGMLAPFSEGLRGDILDLALESLGLFPHLLERLKDLTGAEIFYRQGEAVLRLILSEEEERELRSLTGEYMQRGEAVKRLTPEELKSFEEGLGRDVRGGWIFPREGNVDAEALMDTLLVAVGMLGVRVEIDDIRGLETASGKVKGLRGLKGTYKGDFYIFATGAWSADLFRIPLVPEKGQILKVRGSLLRRILYSREAYLIPKERFTLIGATSERRGFDPKPTLEGCALLSAGALRVFPPLGGAEFVSLRVGFRPLTPDGKPVFELGENYAILTGHHRHGILLAPATARLILDYLEKGIRSSCFDLFSLRRWKATLP